jgi:hypothetical protein
METPGARAQEQASTAGPPSTTTKETVTPSTSTAEEAEVARASTVLSESPATKRLRKEKDIAKKNKLVKSYMKSVQNTVPG